MTPAPSPQPLDGLRIVEGASFVAGPSAGLALAQLGADVIRVDPPGGGSDFLRWPLSSTGDSLFWAGLNKGKRSVTIDHRTEQGRELLLALVAAPGSGAGIFLDNMVGRHRLTYDELRARREDVIHVHLQGRSDGSPAVDYTINAEVGVPQMTGPQGGEQPVNHVLPAWDLLSGMVVASGILAAVLHREREGQGAQLELALADVALAGVGNMGWLAEAEMRGGPRVRQGNHMYGSFGVDFETSDGRRLMVVALTEGQWCALRDVTETGAVFAALERALGADLSQEGDRYRLRETIAAVLRPWFAQRDFGTVRELLERAKVLWSPYLDMAEAARAARADETSVAAEMDQPGIGPLLATGRPLRWAGTGAPPVPAPRLGEHTEDVLSDLLGLSTEEIGRLQDAGVVRVSCDDGQRSRRQSEQRLPPGSPRQRSLPARA
ncbi:CoA transferase [Streptomyces sp. DSM 40750]|uniref:CoA transferase n=1 Tax=Streptomyces sp. DSM 40750 TaxID=2801030 RepID=UPI00214AD89A|nr:CoA transferase [Streptomyces sp. DSM 40750]UUU19724.1 CoA transferase [Streptomyces sp. DSM 40750]